MYKVFMSHGKKDLWLASQMAKEMTNIGASVFLDESGIPKGANFKSIIQEELSGSRELVALLTPWSVKRSWLWIEIGAAWIRNMPIIAVLHGMNIDELEESGQGKAILDDINVLDLNDFDVYLQQLKNRVVEGRK